MLLGALLFGMVLFYLVNYPDDDIRRYSWQIINTTISIFCAVLIYTGCEAFLDKKIFTPLLGAFPHGTLELIRVWLGLFVFLVWYAVMELVCAIFSNHLKHHLKKDEEIIEEEYERDLWVISEGLRADNGTPIDGTMAVQNYLGEKGLSAKDGREVFIVRKANIEAEAHERRTKCWSMLFAHMAGFAFIGAGGDLQHSPAFLDNFWMLMLSVVICAVFLLAIFWLTERLRAEPKDYDEAIEAFELYEENAEEAEDDCFCLAISFLLVQAIKFGLTGVMPAKLGTMPGGRFDFWAVVALYLIGVAFIAVTIIAARFRGRAANLTVGTFADSFAWCTLFATRWALEHIPALTENHVSPSSIQGRVLMSTVLSFGALAVIIVLDKIEDWNPSDDDVHKVVKNAVTGLSILIGFTWEHSFDGAVEAIASVTEEPLVIQITGVIVISIVVIPAWRKFILAKLIELQKEQQARKNAMMALDGETSFLKDYASEAAE